MSYNYSKYKDTELYLLLHGKREEAEAAFSELYARHSQRIYAYCLRVLGNQEDAQDIHQETFLKFYHSSVNKEYVQNVSAYLLTIARNLCLNHIRTSKISVRIEDYQMKTIDVGYEQKELLQLISQALEMLEFGDREVFVLRQYHSLDYEEIASIVGDSITAVKSRIWRAKEKIKKILSPYLADLSK